MLRKNKYSNATLPSRNFCKIRQTALFGTVLLGLFAATAAVTAQTSENAAKVTTRIEADDKAGVIRFYIKGEERALLDETGLHVLGDLTHSGLFIDEDKSIYQNRSSQTQSGQNE